MSFPEAYDVFSIRYYQWAREQFRRELNEDFPLLRKMRTRPAQTLIQLMKNLNRERQFDLASALIKRFHPRATQILNEMPSDDELQLIKRYVDTISSGISSSRHFVTQREKINRKKLAAIVKSQLTPIFHQDPEDLRGGVWRYTTSLRHLVLYTRVDFGGKHHMVSYSHDIVFSGNNLLVQFASFLSWMGLSSQTHWTDLDETNAEGIALLLAQLSSRFLDAANGLVEGVIPPGK